MRKSIRAWVMELPNEDTAEGAGYRQCEIWKAIWGKQHYGRCAKERCEGTVSGCVQRAVCRRRNMKQEYWWESQYEGLLWSICREDLMEWDGRNELAGCIGKKTEWGNKKLVAGKWGRAVYMGIATIHYRLQDRLDRKYFFFQYTRFVKFYKH